MKNVVKTAIFAAAMVGGASVLLLQQDETQNIAAAMWGHEKDGGEEVAKSYILQGKDTQYIASVVSSVGGDISREFPIINAVSATLTSAQASEIKSTAGIRIQDDRTVMTMGNPNQQNLPYSINNNIAEQVGADRLHDMYYRGYGVTVAVIDSGANLGGNEGQYIFRNSYGYQKVAVKYDAISGKKSYRYNDDKNGHGTHVTSIIGSALQSDTGKFNGIAPGAFLLPIKAFNASGQSSYSKVLDALNWVYENRYRYAIRVVNMSLGTDPMSRYWDDPINQAVMRLWDAGIVVVASAGNSGDDMGITVPGNNPYVITVGAAADNETPFDFSDDRIASFSAKGPTFDGFVKPDIVAPGTQIAQKMDARYFYRKPKESSQGDNYFEISGTSQAAAVVSGIAALIIQSNPYISPDDVKCRIMAASRASVTEGRFNFSPFEQGAGLVDAYEAVFSSASGCANKGLDIKADLRGEKRYLGPVVKDADGEFAITMQDGSMLLNGAHWGNRESMDLLGAHWGAEALDLQGAHWGTEQLNLLGAHWANEELDLLGAHWGGAELDLLGAHWSLTELDLQGAHWSGGELDLLGAHWGKGEAMNLLSAEVEELEPIDPNTVVPVEEDGWQ
ncbi:S8 family peptidase [Glaciecola sp. 1036]|uniref:S8 family peptidase n=1 Tax=Alteromonadaceae TaxID=72275 RepID=UPI003D067A8F